MQNVDRPRRGSEDDFPFSIAQEIRDRRRGDHAPAGHEIDAVRRDIRVPVAHLRAVRVPGVEPVRVRADHDLQLAVAVDVPHGGHRPERRRALVGPARHERSVRLVDGHRGVVPRRGDDLRNSVEVEVRRRGRGRDVVLERGEDPGGHRVLVAVKPVAPVGAEHIEVIGAHENLGAIVPVQVGQTHGGRGGRPQRRGPAGQRRRRRAREENRRSGALVAAGVDRAHLIAVGGQERESHVSKSRRAADRNGGQKLRRAQVVRGAIDPVAEKIARRDPVPLEDDPVDPTINLIGGRGGRGAFDRERPRMSVRRSD